LSLLFATKSLPPGWIGMKKLLERQQAEAGKQGNLAANLREERESEGNKAAPCF
jgi:hypothetical protein